MPESAAFRELIDRVRNRDEQAAWELAEKYEKVIRRVVRVHMRDRRMRRVLDSTDVCQSVLASFFVRTALGQYDLDSPAKLMNLLTTITRNKLANQVYRMRANRRDIARNTSLDSEEIGLVDRASDPTEQASARELLGAVCGRLDCDERYLAEQRSLGRTWPDLADEMGGTDVALRKKLTRALDRVMTELGIEHGDV